MNTFRPKNVPSELRRATQRSSPATITSYVDGNAVATRTTTYQSAKCFDAFMNWQADKRAARLGMTARTPEEA